MPFADYRDFADCVSRNGDKDSPESYCGAIKRDTEDKQDGPAEQPDRQLTLAVLGATIASMESVISLHDTPKSKHKDHGPKGKGGGEVKQSRLTRRKSPGGTDLGYYVDVEELGQRYDVQDGEGYGWEITSRGWTDSNEAREGKVEWATGRTSFKDPKEAERWISALDEVVQRHAGKDYGFGNSSSPRIQVEVSEDGKTAKVKEYDWGRWEDTASLQGDGGVKKHKDSQGSTEHHRRAGAPKLDPESSNRGGGAATRDAKKDARSLYRRLDRDVQDAFKEQFKDAANSQDSGRMRNVLDRWTEDPYGAGLRGGTTSLSRSLTRESLASTEAVISLHDTPNSPHSEHMKGAKGRDDEGDESEKEWEEQDEEDQRRQQWIADVEDDPDFDPDYPYQQYNR